MKALILILLSISLNAFSQAPHTLCESDIKFSDITKWEVHFVESFKIEAKKKKFRFMPPSRTEPYCILELKEEVTFPGAVVDPNMQEPLITDKPRRLFSGGMYKFEGNSNSDLEEILCYNIRKPSDIAKGFGDYAVIFYEGASENNPKQLKLAVDSKSRNLDKQIDSNKANLTPLKAKTTAIVDA